jgi:branched-chain amino acid transport system permease protein
MEMSERRGTVRRILGKLRSGPNTVGNSGAFWIAFAIGAIVLLLQPLFRTSYAASQFAIFLVFGLLALSLSLVWGYTGVLSFAQMAFLGIGAYTYAIVSLNMSELYSLEPATASTIALPAAILAAGGSAFLLGYFMFYGEVRDVYVAILTLVVALVLKTFMDQTAGAEWTIGEVQLGGFNGIPGVRNFYIGVGELGIGIEFANDLFYWLVFAVLLVTYLGLRALVNGRIGYVLVAVREDQDRTEMLGYDVRKAKLGVFTFAGALAGLAGVFYVTWGNYVSPDRFTLVSATLPVIWLSFGGRESLLGAVVGAVTIEWLRNWFSVNAPEFAIVFVGTILLVTILLLPSGIVPALRDIILTVRALLTDYVADREDSRAGEVMQE